MIFVGFRLSFPVSSGQWIIANQLCLSKTSNNVWAVCTEWKCEDKVLLVLRKLLMLQNQEKNVNTFRICENYLVSLGLLVSTITLTAADVLKFHYPYFMTLEIWKTEKQLQGIMYCYKSWEELFILKEYKSEALLNYHFVDKFCLRQNYLNVIDLHCFLHCEEFRPFELSDILIPRKYPFGDICRKVTVKSVLSHSLLLSIALGTETLQKYNFRLVFRQH